MVFPEPAAISEKYDIIIIDSYSQIPWIHMNEFSFCFQSLYVECSKSHNPVVGWCFLQALLWLEDGSEGFNHFLYFSFTDMPLSHLTCAEDIPISLDALALLTTIGMNNNLSKLWIPTFHTLQFVSKVSCQKAHTYPSWMNFKKRWIVHCKIMSILEGIWYDHGRHVHSMMLKSIRNVW